MWRWVQIGQDGNIFLTAQKQYIQELNSDKLSLYLVADNIEASGDFNWGLKYSHLELI